MEQTSWVPKDIYRMYLAELGFSQGEECPLWWLCLWVGEWNTPHASHQNGAVETLTKSVRQALNSTCKNDAYSDERWRAFLSEITYMVNGRPLYPVPTKSGRPRQSLQMTFLSALTIHHRNQKPRKEPIRDSYSEARKTELQISRGVGWSILPQTLYYQEISDFAYIQTGDLVYWNWTLNTKDVSGKWRLL